MHPTMKISPKYHYITSVYDALFVGDLQQKLCHSNCNFSVYFDRIVLLCGMMLNLPNVLLQRVIVQLDYKCVQCTVCVVL